MVFQQIQRQPPCREGVERLGVALDKERLFKEPVVYIALLHPFVSFHMGEDDLQARAVLQGQQLFKNLLRPGDERHLDKQQVGALYREARYILAVGYAWIIEYLCAEDDLRLGIGEQGSELLIRVRTPPEKALRRFVVAVEVRGGYDSVDTLLFR